MHRLLFALPPHAAHSAAFAALGPVEHIAPLRALVRSMFSLRDPRIATRVMGLEFPSPLGLAGGFDKNALRPRALAALGFGHLELGTVTAKAQAANPAPNLFRLTKDRALINRLGFPNEGAEAIVRRLADKTIEVPVGISIGKSRDVPLAPIEGAIDDYLASFRAVQGSADFVVVNVSSPNTKDLRSLQGAEVARSLLGAITAEAKKPVLLKIAPDLSDGDIEDLLAVVEEVRLAGVVATNTTIARPELKTPGVAEMGAGGLSGQPLRARALEVVRRVRARLGRSFVVIGVGGIETADHAMDMLRAGANLVQMYTGFIYEGPLAPKRIARGLARMVEREGARDLEELLLR